MAQRVLYLVTEDWYFVSHRLPMARAARDAGFEVHVATRVRGQRAAIEAEGFRLQPVEWRRGSVDPSAALRTVADVRTILRRVEPQLVHAVGVQPSVLGTLAAVGLPVVTLAAIAGMGFAFTSASPRARAVRAVLSAIMRASFGRGGGGVLVQNPDDRAAMLALGIRPSAITLIPGSGVDTRRLVPLADPPGPFTMAYVGRLLEDKGLAALLEAHRLLRSEGRDVRLLLAGERDPANPASFAQEVLDAWRQREGVTLLGHVQDIRTVWAAAHVAVLPSRREGLPLSLLEAAACGRALVATDVPGCREVARPGVNAELVPVDAAAPLARAIARLADDPARRARYADASRALAEAEFSSDRIGAEVVALYRRLIHARASGVAS